jgi:hypothetical protein
MNSYHFHSIRKARSVQIMSATSHHATADSPRLRSVKGPTSKTGQLTLDIPWRKIGIYVAVALGFLMLGAVPMWLRASNFAIQRDVAQRELGISQMENQLSESAIRARRGDYEPARQSASDFFTNVRHQVDLGAASAFSQSQREKLSALLTQRDDIITLLARSDPAAADRLSDFYVKYVDITKAVQPEAGTK